MSPTRRAFLSSVAATAALPLVGHVAAPARTSRPMKILVLGGTAFLGPPFVRAAMARGHEVTLFNRGKTNPEMFRELEQLRGDRDEHQLDALKGRKWDAVVDTSAYVPGHVREVATLLRDQVEHYQVISTISVYNSFRDQPPIIDESAKVSRVAPEVVEKTTRIRQAFANYGAMKALCEEAAEAVMPGRTVSLRPGLIVGPGDKTDRFTYWPMRMQRGGEVLCPGERDAVSQFVDVRDLAAFMLHCVEQKVTGVHNTLGFAGRTSFGEVLAACKCSSREDAQLTWVAEDFLMESKVRPFVEMAMWVPADSLREVRNAKAIAAGMKFRPIADTIRDTLHWALAERGDDPLRAGLEPGREQELLRKWHARPAGGERR